MVEIIPVEGGFEVRQNGELVKAFKSVWSANKCMMKRLWG